MEVLSEIKHRNIVQFLGFCDEDGEQIRVYEYVENGSLSLALNNHPEFSPNPLSLKQRLEISLGIADALAYLHKNIKRTDIYIDIETLAILLDSGMKPKLCNIRVLDHSEKFSYGINSLYAPKEYFQGRSLVTPESDVYSFGVILLELITGKDPTFKAENGSNLVKWALNENISVILDPKLDYPSSSLDSQNAILRRAKLCLDDEKSNRPKMKMIVSLLNMVVSDINNPNQGQNSDSENFLTSETSSPV